MAARNAAPTIRLALESVLQQEYPSRVDIVVVDDASEDATPNIVSEYPNVSLVRNSHRLGRSLSRNRALSLVDTTLVAIQDADDYSERNRLIDTASLIKSGTNTIVGGQVAWTDPRTGNFDGGTWPTVEEDALGQLLRGRMPVAHPAMVLPTDMVRAVNGYNSKFPVGEDLDLLLRIREKMPDVSILNSREIVVRYHRPKMDKFSYIASSNYWRKQIMNDNAPLCPRQSELSWVRNSVDGYLRQRVRAAKELVSRSVQ
ncbi:UNVERIFIED_ORG: glycosyltransferase involved in cell wall biosynthesis [Arthrobacter sp. UYEF2]